MQLSPQLIQALLDTLARYLLLFFLHVCFYVHICFHKYLLFFAPSGKPEICFLSKFQCSMRLAVLLRLNAKELKRKTKNKIQNTRLLRFRSSTDHRVELGFHFLKIHSQLLFVMIFSLFAPTCVLFVFWVHVYKTVLLRLTCMIWQPFALF